jgi:NUMOD3 motif
MSASPRCRIRRRPGSLTPAISVMSAVLLIFHSSHAFVTRRHVWSLLPRGEIDTICLPDRNHVFACRSQRRRWTSRPSSTSLWDVVDKRDEEAIIEIHGDQDGYRLRNGSETASTFSSSSILGGIDLTELDVPKPTENGGFSHTVASKAKIGAANKGKVPWNKGRERSPEERSRIAAGVRARNREKFLQQLNEMGVTEEEYEQKKKEERRKKDAERRARRTENGGYRPTAETKAKISKILKEKHARGEISRRTVDPLKVRRGFTQSEETKQKISESLRMRWSLDPEYRERMTTNMKKAYNNVEVRQKLSETLKKKWQDPGFREEMLEKMSKRRRSPDVSDEYRQKISISMKKKWQDPEYRAKTIDAMTKNLDSGERKSRAALPAKPPRAANKSKKVTEVRMMQPLAPGEARKKAVGIPRKKVGVVPSAAPVQVVTRHPPAEKKQTLPKRKVEPDGSVNRLREERRDLFDLLYGDEASLHETAQEDEDSETHDSSEVDTDSLLDNLSSRFDFGDEDLDSFDPYGLDDY